MPNRRRLSELTVFFGQFIDHTIIATPVNDEEPMNIPIPSDDPIFANFTSGYLPFERSVRGQMRGFRSPERPINSLSSMLDLSSVYGTDDARVKALRSHKGGRLRESDGRMLPVNDVGLRNAPNKERAYFLAGDHRANEHPVLTSLHTLFVREHNLLCEELQALFETWEDEELFQTARKINIAQFQKIVFTEFYPAMTGRNLGPYRKFRSSVNPTISDIFSTAAYRIGHTMVGNGINRRGPGMKHMTGLSMTEMFFRPAGVMKEGISPFLRGALFHRAQEVDLLVHNSLRNFLFKNVPHEKGFDLVALNLQRGRDHALPTYNGIRQMMRMRPVRNFQQISRDRTVQAKLMAAYGTVNRVEAWPGLLAEDHFPGASMGPTMLTIWFKEFSRMRDGDRFFYWNRGLFSQTLWKRMPRIPAMFQEKEILRDIILRNTKVTEAEIGRTVWMTS